MTTVEHRENLPVRTRVGVPTITLISMVLAPALFLASTIAFLTLGDGINDGLIGGVINAWTMIVLVMAFAGCARAVESVMPKSAQFILFGGAAAGVGGAGFGMTAIYQQVLQDDHGVDGATTLDAHPFSILALLPWGWFMPVTCMAVGLCLWRGQLAPWWHGVLFILGGLLFVTGRPTQMGFIAVTTDLVLLVAFWLLASRLRGGTLGHDPLGQP